MGLFVCTVCLSGTVWTQMVVMTQRTVRSWLLSKGLCSSGSATGDLLTSKTISNLWHQFRISPTQQVEKGQSIYMGSQVSNVWTFYSAVCRSGTMDHKIQTMRYHEIIEDEMGLWRLTWFNSVWLFSCLLGKKGEHPGEFNVYFVCWVSLCILSCTAINYLATCNITFLALFLN